MFVVDALARNFALELRKRQQHVEGKTTHAGGGVESSRHRDKRDVMFIEEFDQLGEVGKRPCQTIDLVDDDDTALMAGRANRRPPGSTDALNGPPLFGEPS
jgi:hypothetical protein